MLRNLKCSLITRGRSSTVQVDTAAVPYNARVETFVIELQFETQLIAVIRNRALQVGDSQHRSDVFELARICLHGLSCGSLTWLRASARLLEVNLGPGEGDIL